MNKLNITHEAKKPKYVDIGGGFYVNKVGMDDNGNSSVWVSKGSNRAKKIQMSGNIKDKSTIMDQGIVYFQDKNDPDVKKAIEQIKDYYKKYLTKESSHKTAKVDEKVIKDKLKREFSEVTDNMIALGKELKKTNLDKSTITSMISWAVDALNKANETIQTLDTKLIK